MSSPSERVRALVRGGSIAPDEGERLLSALGDKRPPSGWKLLLDPFERYGGGAAAAIGLVVAAAAVATTRLGIDYDGFLDLHAVLVTPSLGHAIIEQGVVWLIPALLFWLYAAVANRKARLLDFVGVVGLSRLPYPVTALFVSLLKSGATSSSFRDASAPVVVLLVVSAVGGLGALLTLLYQGFKHASGLRGPRLVAGFIGVALASEILSKMILPHVA